MGGWPNNTLIPEPPEPPEPPSIYEVLTVMGFVLIALSLLLYFIIIPFYIGIVEEEWKIGLEYKKEKEEGVLLLLSDDSRGYESQYNEDKPHYN